MPRKKISTTKKVSRESSSNYLQALNTNSYKSLLYGVIAVIVLFLFAAVVLRIVSNQKGSVGDNGITTAAVENVYVVRAGDNLTSIATDKYNNPEVWKEIASANNINNPNSIEVGQELTLPSVDFKSPTEGPTQAVTSTPTPTVAKAVPTKAQTKSPSQTKIIATAYKVQAGDTLWSIAERAYGDPYKWVQIAETNKLVNPDLIHSGNVFRIPR